MAWQTPKTNWSASDGVRNTDFNRIEGNLLELYNMESAKADTTLFVSTTGNDNTGLGTSANPYRTINKAVSMLPRNLSGKTCIINVQAGTYNENVLIENFAAGVIRINGASNANVVVTGITVQGAHVLVSDIQLTVGSGGIAVGAGGILYSASSNFIVNGAANGATVRYGGILVVNRTLTINNATGNALWVQYGGMASMAVLAGTGNYVGINVQNSIVYCQTNNIAATIGSGIVAGQIFS